MALTAEQQQNENIARTARFAQPTSETPIPTNEAISSTTLQDTGSVNFPTQQPTPDINTAEAQIGAQGDALVESITAQTDAKAKQAEADLKNSQSGLDQFISGQQGFEGFYAKETQDRGIEDIQGNIAQLKGTIRSEQAARAEMKQRIETQGGGLKIGANAEYQNFARDSLFKETNAVIQMGVYSDNLSAAERLTTIANAYYKQEQNELQRRQNLVDDNKDLFDKYELRQFTIDYTNAQRELDKQQKELDLLQTTKIDALQKLQLNEDPKGMSDKVASADTVEDVIRIAGQAGVTDLLSREQLRASVASSWASYDLNKMKIKAEQDKQAQIDAAIENGGYVLDETQRGNAYKIGKEYETESSEFKKQVGAYNRIVASAEDPSAAGDLSMIFNYMKMLDPGSVVRESEFATAQNAAGVPDRIRAQYNNVINGQKLADAQRNDFVDRAQDIYDISLDQQIDLENRYRDKAVNIFGLPENAANDVVQDIRAVGTVSDIAFGLQIDNMSVDQQAQLIQEGLLPSSSQAVAQ